MNFFDQKTLFCLSKQYAIYENKAAEKQDIGINKNSKVFIASMNVTSIHVYI